MDTSYSKKAIALLGAVAKRPQDALAYVRHLPCWKRQPIDLGMPWFSYGAINFLRGWLRPTHAVFEFGSGGSTFFFARQTAKVLSVENDPLWHKTVNEKLTADHVINASVEFHPLADDERETFLRSTFAQRIESARWDVIVVDCYCGFATSRYGLIRPAAVELAKRQLNPGGIIVLDDSWMYPDFLRSIDGWEAKDFRGLGPARYGVTSTAILQRAPRS